MNQRPAKDEYSAYYERYISLVPEGNLQHILAEQLEETTRLLAAVSEDQGNYRYAEGKWSLKEVVGHITDNERIMGYRLLMIGRGVETPQPGYDQNILMNGASFQSMTLSGLVEDYTAVRRSTLTLFNGMSEEAWIRKGVASNFDVTARAAAAMISGHELHHINIIREKYLNA